MSPSPGQEEKQSSGARDIYVDPAAEKVVEDEKKRAEKDPLIGLNDFTGDVPETHITNAMTRLPGFPARLENGELVDIVRKAPNGRLIAADGTVYMEGPAEGKLVPWEDNRPSGKGKANVQPPYGMTQKAAEAAAKLQKEADEALVV